MKIADFSVKQIPKLNLKENIVYSTIYEFCYCVLRTDKLINERKIFLHIFYCKYIIWRK